MILAEIHLASHWFALVSRSLLGLALSLSFALDDKSRLGAEREELSRPSD